MSASTVGDGAQEIVIEQLDFDYSRPMIYAVLKVLLTPVLAACAVAFLVALFLGNGRWWFPLASVAVGCASYFCGRFAFRFFTMRKSTPPGYRYWSTPIESGDLLPRSLVIGYRARDDARVTR